MASWLMLMVSLPPSPSSLRVRVWRKLRTLGAVALRPSVYLLPRTPDNFERFQWLSQEVKDDQEVLTHGMTPFDGLYAALNDRP